MSSALLDKSACHGDVSSSVLLGIATISSVYDEPQMKLLPCTIYHDDVEIGTREELHGKSPRYKITLEMVVGVTISLNVVYRYTSFLYGHPPPEPMNILTCVCICARILGHSWYQGTGRYLVPWYQSTGNMHTTLDSKQWMYGATVPGTRY